MKTAPTDVNITCVSRVTQSHYALCNDVHLYASGMPYGHVINLLSCSCRPLLCLSNPFSVAGADRSAKKKLQTDFCSVLCRRI